MSTVIDPDIAARHWIEAAREQTMKDLEGEGFEVRCDEPLDGAVADLVARRGDEVRVLAFKAVGRPGDSRRIRELRRKAVGLPHASFHLILVSLPRQKKIMIAEIERSLRQALAEHVEVRALLPADTWIEEVRDVDLDEVEIDTTGFDLRGTATLVVVTDIDDELLDDSYPCRFQVTLNAQGQVRAVESLQIDLDQGELPFRWQKGAWRLEGSTLSLRNPEPALTGM